MTITEIAELCHELNRLIARAAGNEQEPPWAEVSRDDYFKTIDRVAFFACCADSPQEYHDRWASARIKNGWKWGLDFDPVEKTDPELIPFVEMEPAYQARLLSIKLVTSSLMQPESHATPVEAVLIQ